MSLIVCFFISFRIKSEGLKAFFPFDNLVLQITLQINA
jgi:hypothetical protein